MLATTAGDADTLLPRCPERPFAIAVGPCEGGNLLVYAGNRSFAIPLGLCLVRAPSIVLGITPLHSAMFPVPLAIPGLRLYHAPQQAGRPTLLSRSTIITPAPLWALALMFSIGPDRVDVQVALSALKDWPVERGGPEPLLQLCNGNVRGPVWIRVGCAMRITTNGWCR